MTARNPPRDPEIFSRGMLLLFSESQTFKEPGDRALGAHKQLEQTLSLSFWLGSLKEHEGKLGMTSKHVREAFPRYHDRTEMSHHRCDE